MSLQFILGSSGAGKSRLLYEEMIAHSMVNPNQNYLVVVPEQFTMQTQKDLVSLHPNHGIMNIDVLSFMRLAYRVFDELHGEERQVLEDMGKTLILRKVVETKKEELQLFRSNVNKQGFIGELKSFLSELYQYSITEEDLKQMIDRSQKKPMLQSKLVDVMTVYQGFKQYLSEKYITSEEILDVLFNMIDSSSLIENSVVCLDGFTGFTPSQYQLLTKILRRAKKVLITLTLDPRENLSIDEEFHLFHLSKKTMNKLHTICKEEGVTVEKPIWAGLSKENQTGKIPYRFLKSEPLAALEHNLFRYRIHSYDKEQDDISIHLIKNPKQEVAFVIREIRRLLQEEGYRYRDIAVVTGDLPSYSKIIEHALEQAGIPCFIDVKKEILSNPLVEMLRALLEMVRKDFAYESVFRYLRCGLVSITADRVDKLENYVLALGIRGFKRYSEPFTRTYRVQGELDLEEINAIREELMEGVLEVREALKKPEATVLDYTTALYEFILSNQIYDKLELYRTTFEEQAKPLLAKEYGQIFKLVMDLFDQMVELLGDEQMPIKEYEELLATGFTEAKVGLIPLGVDLVVVGDIERTRLKDIKALFFIGVNDGIIPKAGGAGGIISDLERELLVEENFELAPTERQNAYTEQFYLYLNMTKPQNRLYVTYSKVGNDGKTLRASYMISKLLQVFPKMSIIDEDDIQENLNVVLGYDQGISYLISGLNSNETSDIWKELYCYYANNPEYEEMLKNWVQGAFYVNEEKSLSKAVARLLYGCELSNSVTRLEQYAACAFAHFLTYGLNLVERQEFKLAVPDIGNIFHNALDIFSKKMKDYGLSFRTIEPEKRDELVKESVREAAGEYNNTILLSSKRNEYMIERVERITKRTVWALCEHMKKGKFEPKGFEVMFGKGDQLEISNVSLSDEELLRLRGRIDRLDVYEDESHVYVKVIDYKSGNMKFDIVSLYYGLQMQLIVYLDAAMALEQGAHPDKEVVPAGVFYYHIDDPIVDELDDPQKVETELLKALKLNGLVNNNTDVIKLLDQSFDNGEGGIRGSVNSLVIPVDTNKEGYPKKYSSTVSSTQFELLRRFVHGKVKQFGQGILSGDTTIEPYRMGNRTACDYCSYRGICGFDQKIPGYAYRSLRNCKKEEIWDTLKEEVEQDNNTMVGGDNNGGHEVDE